MPLTVVVDEEFARLAWPGEEALGRRVRLAREGQPWRTVVGIVPVTDHEAEMRAAWFLPYYQDPTGGSTEQLHIMVRGAGLPTMAAMREVIAGIDPALAVYGTTTMEALQRERRSPDRLGAVVSAVFAVFGLLLAGFSLYGLLAYSVELRRSEIGIRMALGAKRREIVSLVLRQAIARFVAGTVVGTALALAANRVLQGMIAGLGDVSWRTMTLLAALMAVVTFIAAAAPAMRATRVEALRSLRS
jgi:predicted lysophospholipase L1 biosynthesis ABC-type transport system permease subunit